jgi:hypothetical protein
MLEKNSTGSGKETIAEGRQYRRDFVGRVFLRRVDHSVESGHHSEVRDCYHNIVPEQRHAVSEGANSLPNLNITDDRVSD